MSVLDEIYARALDIADHFGRKALLWIGSESYDAPSICVLEGLSRLGFAVYTVGKPNVNSWFCNRVIDDPSGHEFDFVLSALHWGTRWDYYGRYGLGDCPKVLIDGDDTFWPGQTWRDKYALWVGRYGYGLEEGELSSDRWMVPLGDYEPDVLFTMQRQRGDAVSHYIPSGIHSRYLAMGEPSRPLAERHIDFAHVPGPGVWRTALRDLLELGMLPGTVHNSQVRGEPVYPAGIEALAKKDDNVHSYHRWACWRSFYGVLNHSKVLLHPGIDGLPFWDCQRPYEGWACGCVVAMSVPCTDVSEYPPTDVCPEAVYGSHEQLAHVAGIWRDQPGYLKLLREKTLERAHKFFTPEAVARYFLLKVKESL